MALTLSEALEVLRSNEGMLRERGVLHAAIFGSVARGEARSDSDVDVLVDLDPNARIGIFQYAGIQSRLADLFGRNVDLLSLDSLSRTKERVLREKVDAF